MSGSSEAERDARIRVYLDANAFIEAVEGRSDLSNLLVALLATEDRRRERFVTSELTLSELLVKPFELGRDDLVEAYERVVTENDAVTVVTVGRGVLRDAARLRSLTRSLRLPDAIHVATARVTGCTHFLTGDKGIKSGDGLEVVRLNEADIRHLHGRLAHG